ncbi:hypothetical protein [Hydrogenimonas sp.]
MKVFKMVLFVFLFLSLPLFGMEWRIFTDKDVMDGSEYVTLNSERVLPIKQMAFPYQETKVLLGITCKKNTNWKSVFLAFNIFPNIINIDDYNSKRIRIKFDNKMEYYTVYAPRNEKMIYFADNDKVIKNLKRAEIMILELPWYGEGNVYLKFSLKGSSKAINELFRQCKQ